MPSPMALSRYDNVSVNSTNVNLFSFGRTTGAYVNAFWSPGIGMWQFDSAGGWPFSAAGAIDSVTAANQAATTISYRWCNAPTSQQVDDATRRKYAWGPWYGCSTTIDVRVDLRVARLRRQAQHRVRPDRHPLRRHAAAHVQRRRDRRRRSPAGT